MSTFCDFLVWYNNLDVGPFVTAVEWFQAFYFRKGIDVFKTAILVPGIARQLLFKSARKQHANFAFFDQNNDDLYQIIKQNIVGGPSIIFTRHHCAGKTFIGSGKQCGSILGFDANALYLQAIGKPMPVGPFVRRLADNNFRPEIRDRYMAAYYWMDWLVHNNHISIQHKLNYRREVRIGKYQVDGYAPATSPGEKATVFQFHGCYWHGQLCSLTRNIKDEKWKASSARKYKKTLQTTAYLKREHRVIEMWEYQFRQYCQENPAIYDFIDSTRPGFFQRHRGEISDKDIRESVFKGEIFGMVEVDIQVPEQWPLYFHHPSLSPYQYFQEMSPLFCTTDIPFDAIGHHVQRHGETNDLPKISR